MKIVNLKDLPSCVDKIASWHFSEWGGLYPDSGLEDFKADMEASLVSCRIPQTWVLMENGVAWGTVSILATDLPTCPELSPWLANVYVEPSKRGCGYGQQLVKVAMGYAEQQNLSPLFLYTPDQVSFYEKLGWNTFKDDIYQGEKIFFMSI